MDNREIAIQITGLKKKYKLGQIGGGSLQADLESWWARVRGKEDPNSKIGSDQRSNGKTFMALNGIDMTVYKGEALGIIGHNGAGKSTLLKLLSRVTAPTEGEICMNGRIASMLEVGTGFNGEMTGRENVYMNGAILGMTKAEVDAKMEQIIDFSEVREFIDTPVKRYSSGMYVKLAFSVAAHLDSEIMIMDEVLAVGDMAFQKKCLDKMREAAKQDGRTVLYVSHNMNTIRQLCDRCIVLDKGKKIFDGAVEEGISKYFDNLADISDYYEFTKTQRSGSRSTDKFVMQSLNVEMPEKGYFQCGDTISVKLKFHSEIKIDNLCFRMSIQSQSRLLAGTMMSAPIMNAKAGKTQIVNLSVDTTNLVAGVYDASIVAYTVNLNGTENWIDGVYPAFRFEIHESERKEGELIWHSEWWGNVRLKNITGEEYQSL